MLHHTADDAEFAVGNAIHIDLGGVLQKAVHQNGTLGAGFHGSADVAAEVGFIMDDFHGTPAENKGGADQHGIANARGDIDGLLLVRGGAALGLAQPELVEHGREVLPILGHFNAARLGANDGATICGEAGGEVQRGLTTELHDDGIGFFPLIDIEDILERERLEVELVAGVVIGGNRLGVGIDHDGLPTEFLQREGGVDAAVVELDTLADAVRSTAEDENLLFVAAAGFVLIAVGGIVIGRERLKLRRAGVHEAVSGNDASGLARLADFGFGGFEKMAELAVGKPKALGAAKVGGRQRESQ